jgi:hypothetical protein
MVYSICMVQNANIWNLSLVFGIVKSFSCWMGSVILDVVRFGDIVNVREAACLIFMVLYKNTSCLMVHTGC